MKKLLRVTAALVSSLSLAAGAVGMVGASSINTTGPDSTTRIEHRNTVTTDVDNDTHVGVTNNNPQTARSGNVNADRNTTVGDTSSGTAHNDSLLRTSVSVDNSSATNNLGNCGCNNSANDSSDSISLTGPDSHTTISSSNVNKTNINNDTSVTVTNNNSQNATSGNVSANKNTSVGGLSSGDASNISTLDTTVNVTN